MDVLLQLLVEASVRAYPCRLTQETPFSRAVSEFKASLSNRKAWRWGVAAQRSFLGNEHLVTVAFGRFDPFATPPGNDCY